MFVNMLKKNENQPLIVLKKKKNLKELCYIVTMSNTLTNDVS